MVSSQVYYCILPTNLNQSQLNPTNYTTPIQPEPNLLIVGSDWALILIYWLGSCWHFNPIDKWVHLGMILYMLFIVLNPNLTKHNVHKAHWKTYHFCTIARTTVCLIVLKPSAMSLQRLFYLHHTKWKREHFKSASKVEKKNKIMYAMPKEKQKKWSQLLTVGEPIPSCLVSITLPWASILFLMISCRCSHNNVQSSK